MNNPPLSKYDRIKYAITDKCMCDFCYNARKFYFNEIFVWDESGHNRLRQLDDDEIQIIFQPRGSRPKEVVKIACQGLGKPASSTIAARDQLVASMKKTGYNCKNCNSRNDYAVANTSDDKYMCFECR